MCCLLCDTVANDEQVFERSLIETDCYSEFPLDLTPAKRNFKLLFYV
jgi:hypothetical protein